MGADVFSAGIFFWILTTLGYSECSSGDRSSEFLKCLHTTSHLCRIDGSLEYPVVLPFHLTAFGWSCIDEIKYQCMHNATKQHVKLKRPVLQYYGKWPFLRFLGIQEPASTLFSLANMIAHILGWLKFSARASYKYKLFNTAKVYCLISINAWIWSTIFHSRDWNFTEKMDYFSATLLVLSSILVCFTRIIGDPKKLVCFAFGLVLLVLFCFHVFWMGFVKFDYSYNMKFNVGLGVINMFMWLSWCFLKRKERPYVWKSAFIVVSTFLFLGLEVFDFPPLWWTFDAHSIWHLSTVPLCYFWYSFLIDDQRYEILQTVKEQKIL